MASWKTYHIVVMGNCALMALWGDKVQGIVLSGRLIRLFVEPLVGSLLAHVEEKQSLESSLIHF